MQLAIPYFEDVTIPQGTKNGWHFLINALLSRKIDESNKKSLKPIVVFGDNGISNTKYSINHPSFTSAHAILASDGKLHENENLISTDAAIGRYFAELGMVKNLKVASGTKDFSTNLALEPSRLNQAIKNGEQLANAIDTPLVYLSGIGAGNELAAECLVKSLWEIDLALELINQGNIEFNDNFKNLIPKANHPFSHLEKFGGYDTATLLGFIFKSIEKGRLIFIEGASALAAASISIKMFPKTIDFFQIIGYERCTVFDAFCSLNSFNRLFEPSPANYKLFYLEPTQKIINQLVKEISIA